MSKRNLYFYCNANKYEGLGHFMRSFNLSRLLRSKDTDITFVGIYNEWAINVLKKYKVKFIEDELSYFIDVYRNVDLLIIDSYKVRGGALKKLTESYRVLIMDDFNDRKFYNTCAVLNFTVNASGYDYGKIPFKLLGPGYFPFNMDLNKIRKENLQRKSKIKKENIFVLVTLSGTFIESKKILGLIHLLDQSFSNSVICLIHKYPINYTSTKNKFIHVYYTDKISSYFKKADLVVTGGGLTKYESAFCAIPNFTISLNPDQNAETINFEKRNLTRSIGTFYEFNLHSIRKKINKFLMDNGWRIKFYESSKKVFKTNLIKHEFSKILNNE